MSTLRVLDTTVLVAGLVAAHPQHAASARHLRAAATEPGQYRCTTHAIAEAFRVLIALPLVPRFNPDAARTLVRASLLPRLDPAPITAKDYDQALDVVCASGLGGGAIYDALHLLTAERIGASHLVTSNGKHFTKLAEAAGVRLQVVDPADPAVDP